MPELTDAQRARVADNRQRELDFHRERLDELVQQLLSGAWVPTSEDQRAAGMLVQETGQDPDPETPIAVARLERLGRITRRLGELGTVAGGLSRQSLEFGNCVTRLRYFLSQESYLSYSGASPVEVVGWRKRLAPKVDHVEQVVGLYGVVFVAVATGELDL